MNSSNASVPAPARLEQPAGHVSTYFRFGVGKLKAPSGSPVEDGIRLAEGCIAHLCDPSGFPPRLFILLPTPSFVPSYRPFLIGVRNKLADLGFGNVPLIGASVAVCLFDLEAHEQGAMLICLGSRLIEAKATVGLDAQKDPKKAVADLFKRLGVSSEREFNPFDDHFLIAFLPGLAEGAQASEYRADELMAEIRDRTHGSLPIFGGVASNGVVPNGATYQFLNDGVYTEAAVVAMVKCRLVRGFALAEGLKEADQAFRVRTVSHDGHVVTAFHEGSPAEVASKLPLGAFLGECSPEGEQIASIPYLIDGEFHFRRRFRDRSILRVLERDVEGMKEMAIKLVQDARQQSGLRLTRLAGLLFIGCARRYRERKELHFNPAEALRLASEKSPGTEAVGCYMEGELGVNRHGRSVLGFWSLSLALFGDDVPDRAEEVIGFEALAAGTQEAGRAKSLDEAIDCVLHAVEQAGYQGGMVSLVLRDRETQWIVGRRAFGKVWVEEVMPRTRRKLPGEDILAAVAREQKPRCLRDSAAPEERCDPEMVAAAGILSQYIIPLLGDEGKTIALLQVDLGDMRDTVQLKGGQKAVLDAVGGMAAATINRVIRTDELEISRKLDRALIECLACATPEEAAACFLYKAMDILGTNGHVRLCSPESSALRLVGGKGLYYEAAKEYRPVIDINDRSPLAEAVRSAQVIFTNDAQNDVRARVMRKRYQQGKLAEGIWQSGSYAVFPIALPDQKPIGVINLSSNQPWFFTESSLRSLKDIGQRAGVLLAHVEQKRREQEQRQNAQETVTKLRFLLQAAPRAPATASIPEALRFLAKTLCTAAQAQVVSCFLWCKEQMRYVLRGQWGWADPRWVEAAWYEAGEDLTGKCALLQDHRYIRDLRTLKNETAEDIEKYAQQMFEPPLSDRQTYEVIALPVRVREASLGVVTMHRVRPFPVEGHESGFATTDPEILREVGEHLSALVYALLENDRTQWEQREAQRLSNVQERLLQDKPLDTLLTEVCDALVNEYRAESCAVYLTDEERTTLILNARAAQPGSSSQMPTEIRALDSGSKDVQLIERAFANGQTQERFNPKAEDQQDPEKVKRELLLNRISMPIHVGNSLVGVLDICWEGAVSLPGHGAIPRHSRQHLERIADSIAQTINTHRLREEREKSFEVAKTAKQALDGMALTLQKSSHDLASGVNEIASGLSLIADEGLRPTQVQFLEGCRSVVENLARVLRRAMTLGSRIAAPQRSDCLLNDLLLQAINRHRAAAVRADVTIVVGDLKQAVSQVDSTLMAECFDNVIENAVEATPKGGRLDCSMRMPQGSGVCEIVISDTGKGMSREKVNHALGYRRDAAEEWSPGEQVGGVGLFLTRLYCERHGGKVTVVSHPGSGTTVILTIPIQT